ncbi:MAG TPA: twin-arginine translocase subunit TatC [Candidatus Saccharimonadales bacterium]|nr:twin-arginine translocase subunit TatC [Candidatus Saccharimonadales bacterium]
MKHKKKTTSHRRTTSSSSGSEHRKLPFAEHLHELQRRLYKVAASVLLWGGAAYAVEQHLVNILLKPAHGQSFIYTSPGGGIDFLFRICIYTGIALSIPVALYQLLAFLEPVIKHGSRRFILIASAWSGLLAVVGIVFGYFIGLPSALHFLLHQFTTIQIKPLVTIQSYLGFVMAYMLGSALLFQLPIILLSINRIKPLKPSALFRKERWVILAAFVLAGLMNPSPNILSQLIVAGPFIIMYQVGILFVMIANKRNAPKATILPPPVSRPIATELAAAAIEASLPEPVVAAPARGVVMDFRPPARIGLQPQAPQPKPQPPTLRPMTALDMRRQRRFTDFDFLPPSTPRPTQA